MSATPAWLPGYWPALHQPRPRHTGTGCAGSPCTAPTRPRSSPRSGRCWPSSRSTTTTAWPAAMTSPRSCRRRSGWTRWTPGCRPSTRATATMTRNDPSEFGVKDTCTCVELDHRRGDVLPAGGDRRHRAERLPRDAGLGVVRPGLGQAADRAGRGRGGGAAAPQAERRGLPWCPGCAPVTLTISSSLPAGTQACMVMPPPDSSSTPLYRSSVPVKFEAEVIAARPGICTCPGDSRYGMVSLRFSCAVNPLAAQAATPSEPLPSGSDWLAAVFGRAEHHVGVATPPRPGSARTSRSARR